LSSKFKSSSVKKQEDYFSLWFKFSGSQYLDNFFLEKISRVIKGTLIHSESRLQSANSVLPWQFDLLALKLIGQQLEKYSTLAPVYNILNEFLFRLEKIEDSVKISTLNPHILQSFLLFLISFINQCKLTANQGLESGLSNSDVLHDLKLQLYKLRVKFLKDYFVLNFGHVADLDPILRFVDNLFLGLLKSRNFDYSLPSKGSEFLMSDFYGVLNVSDRLRFNKFQRLSNLLADPTMDYAKFGALLDNLFKLEEEQFHNSLLINPSELLDQGINESLDSDDLSSYNLADLHSSVLDIDIK